jgi:hypothetical protein
MILPLHNRTWYSGPKFQYHTAGKKLTVNVAGSSWRIGGLPLSNPVRSVLGEFNEVKPGENAVLDFGAGSWLRYVRFVTDNLPTADVHAVEFEDAFHDDALNVRTCLQPRFTFWTPRSFKTDRRKKFDLILLVNVLNTIPEDEHRRAVFAYLSQRLNPLGWMVVYQRVWVESENPPGALPYDDGWVVPQPSCDYYTYRAKTGAKWFAAQAQACGLRYYRTQTEQKFKAGNTLFRAWEKPF